MNGHKEDWEPTLQTMFQMHLLFVLDHKAKSLCYRSSFQFQNFVLIYMNYIVPTKIALTQQVIARMKKTL